MKFKAGKDWKPAISGVVRGLRAEKGFKQADLAEGLGIPVNGLSLIENGHRDLSMVEFFRLCEITKVSPVEAVTRMVKLIEG